MMNSLFEPLHFNLNINNNTCIRNGFSPTISYRYNHNVRLEPFWETQNPVDCSLIIIMIVRQRNATDLEIEMKQKTEDVNCIATGTSVSISGNICLSHSLSLAVNNKKKKAHSINFIFTQLHVAYLCSASGAL